MNCLNCFALFISCLYFSKKSTGSTSKYFAASGFNKLNCFKIILYCFIEHCFLCLIDNAILYANVDLYSSPLFVSSLSIINALSRSDIFSNLFTPVLFSFPVMPLLSFSLLFSVSLNPISFALTVPYLPSIVAKNFKPFSFVTILPFAMPCFSANCIISSIFKFLISPDVSAQT